MVEPEIPDLCDDDTTPAEDNIVANLHEVIETGAGADHRVSRGSSINRGIRTHFDIVFKNHSPKLGDREKSGPRQRLTTSSRWRSAIAGDTETAP
jgi:hypothetical protein